MIKFTVRKKEESFNKTIRLPGSVIEQVENISAKNGVSFNRLILEMINFALDNMEE